MGREIKIDVVKIADDLEKVLKTHNLPEELIDRIRGNALKTIFLETTNYELPENLDEALSGQMVDTVMFRDAASRFNNQHGWVKRISNLFPVGKELTSITNGELLNLARKIKTKQLLIHGVGEGILRIIALYLRMTEEESRQ